MYRDDSISIDRPKNKFGIQFLLLMTMVFFTVSLLISGCQKAAPDQTPTEVTVAKDENVIRLTTGEWSPYDGEDLPHFGCSPWLIEEAFALEGIEVEFGFFSWSRSYQMAKEGSWDGTVDWADTPEHREAFYLSEENITDQEFVFFHRSDYDFHWESMDDLAGEVVGITSGYVYGDAFKNIMQKGAVTFETASSDEANFRKLLAGRIDVFPMERRVGYFILQKNFSPDEKAQIVHYPTQFDTFRPYLLLSKVVPENEKRIEKFNKGWKRLKESGRYAEIMQLCAPD